MKYYDWKRSSEWLESWEGLLSATVKNEILSNIKQMNWFEMIEMVYLPGD